MLRNSTGRSLGEQDRRDLREAAAPRSALRAAGFRGSGRSSKPARDFYGRVSARAFSASSASCTPLRSDEPSDDLQWLYDNSALSDPELQDLRSDSTKLAKLPAGPDRSEESCAPCIVLARALLAASNCRLSEADFLLLPGIGAGDSNRFGWQNLAECSTALKLVLLNLSPSGAQGARGVPREAALPTDTWADDRPACA